MGKKIVILGAGPTGLGAAYRLQELNHDFRIFEKRDCVGGLASSFIDEKGFTWDIGGHVLFSHYQYFDKLMDSLDIEWLYHERQAWIWMKNRFIPYPFQNNLRHLEKEDMWRCLSTLIELYKNPKKDAKNFKDWIYSTFGEGIAELFMLPYNFKVWAHPAEIMSYNWIGERVAVTDLSRVIKNIIFEIDDISWGPNNKFRFPLRGGTGEIWNQVYRKIDSKKFLFNKEACRIDVGSKIVYFTDGSKEDYDILISTLPLDKLLDLSNYKIEKYKKKLLHNSTHVFGLGLLGHPPDELKKKCWIYYPEKDIPFYRVTIFSNYTPNNVPHSSQYWSLMFEVSESPYKEIKKDTLFEEVIGGAIKSKLLSSREQIVDRWYHFEPYGYPIPSLERDDALKALKELEDKNIFSRGRFGAWKYEVGNMDHSFMQGVELANRIVKGEEEITLWHPEVVNAKK